MIRSLVADFRAVIHLKAERIRNEAYAQGVLDLAEGLPDSWVKVRVERREAVADLLDAIVGVPVDHRSI